MLKIGTRFSYNGKWWNITGFSATKVTFSDGKITSSIDPSMFINLMNQDCIKIIEREVKNEKVA